MAICTNGVPVHQPTPEASMNLNEIEQKVDQLDLGIYELLAAYGNLQVQGGVPKLAIVGHRPPSVDI